uniref:Uncharacterized protein n=2 Tax=Anguilla anguilla TaxID=7936 RepID=A0A0E9RTH9_ANGAN
MRPVELMQSFSNDNNMLKKMDIVSKLLA